MRYLVVLILIVHGFFASAQKSGVPEYREIIVVMPATTVKFQVKTKKVKIKPSDKYTYSWYSNDQIQSTQGGYDGMLLDGIYKEYDNADHLLAQGQFEKGLKTGEWKRWYASGKLKEISHWCKGFMCGEQKIFDENGNTINHYRYSCNKKTDVIAANLEKQKKKEECIAKCKQKCEAKRKARAEKKKLLEEKRKSEKVKSATTPVK
ncbi:MAG: hypothetical protein NT150_08200 [Bacteroidetes bacterium]|nr:hypothetical protein [Bacteroidota bacterium]